MTGLSSSACWNAGSDLCFSVLLPDLSCFLLPKMPSSLEAQVPPAFLIALQFLAYCFPSHHCCCHYPQPSTQTAQPTPGPFNFSNSSLPKIVVLHLRIPLLCSCSRSWYYQNNAPLPRSQFLTPFSLSSMSFQFCYSVGEWKGENEFSSYLSKFRLE